MEPTYVQKWTIKNKAVAKLDRRRAELNKLSSILDSQLIPDPRVCISLRTIRERRNLAKDLDKQIKKIYESDDKNFPKGFDYLVLRDIEKNARKLLAEDSYLYDNKSKTTIGRFLSDIFGRASYSTLLDMAKPKNFDHDAIHKKSSLFHSLLYRSLDSSMILERDSFAGVKKKLMSQLGTVKRIANDFYLSLGMIKKNPQYKIELAPADIGFSYWDGNHFLMAIDPDKIPYYISKTKEKEYLFNNAMALLIGVHELGHGLEEKISENMPKGLKHDSETYNLLLHGPTCEGFALQTEKFFAKWAKKHAEKYNLSKLDMDIINAYLKAYMPEKLPSILHSILELKEREGMYTKTLPQQWQVDAHDKLRESTGVKRYLKDYYLFDEEEIDSVVQQLCYVFGDRNMSNMIKKIKRAVDIRSYVGQSLALNALSTGFWCDPKIQEEFIFKHYLPRAENDGKIVDR